MLAIAATHPVQYQAPLFRILARDLNLPIHVIYGSDFSIAGYRDKEFATEFKWDVDLTSGYPHEFLAHTQKGGAASYEDLRADGLASALSRLKPSALLVMGYSHAFDRAALQWARRNRVPVLLRCEANDAAQARNPIKALLRNMWLRRIYQTISAFLYIGKRAQEHYLRLGVSPQKLWFSPYSVDTSPFCLEPTAAAELRLQTRAREHWQDDDVVLICSGKLIAKKGQDLILRACASLPSAVQKRVVICLVGEGLDRSMLVQLAQTIPQVRVHFCGFQAQRALSQWYCAADLCVQPSRAGETWGLVVNEALLHGLPVIVSNLVGSAPDLITPATGAIVPANDVQALSEAIQSQITRLPSFDAQQSRTLVAKFDLKIAAHGVEAAWRSLQS
jgi:glycosyltransferase involved in cell wall biosynthesis